MYETRIAAGHLRVAASAGAASALDVLGLRNLSGHGFLHAAWYGEGAPHTLRTLVAEDDAGKPLAAIPTVPFGPPIAGVRKVPGSYWPQRSPLIAPECTTFELAQALAHPAAASLGPVWRMDPRRRAPWRAVLAEPVLGDMLCATLLTVSGRVVAFSFDLDDGPIRYGIAGTYRRDSAKCEVGKLANHRAVTDALEAGQPRVDLGAGDSGDKRDMGAEAAYDFTDLLFVRNRTAARLLARVWSAALAPGLSLAHG